MKILDKFKKKNDLSDLIIAKEEENILQNKKSDIIDILLEEDLNLDKKIIPELNDLNDFYKSKEFVNNQILEIISLITKYEHSTSIYYDIQEKLNSEIFNIVVLGEFSRGKSTFINALIGKKILISNILPTTAVLTKIIYSETPKVELILNDGTQKIIKLEELINYTTCLSNENQGLSSQIAEANVYMPLSYCKNNCIIIDTPGVNDINEQNCDITYNFLPKADAAIILLDPDQPFSESDRHFIQDKVLKEDITKIFFVLNKSDLLNQDKILNIKNHIKNRILENGIVKNVKLYTLSSKKALVSKLNNLSNEFELEFNSFENDLSHYLTIEKGRTIIKKISSLIVYSLLKDISTLKIYSTNLKSPISEIEEKHKNFLNVKLELTSNKNEVIQNIDKKKKDFKLFLSSMITKDVEDIFESCEYTEVSNIKNSIELSLKTWVETKLYTQIDHFNKSLFVEYVDELLAKLNNSLTCLTIPESDDPINSLNYDVTVCQSTFKFENAKEKGVYSGLGLGAFVFLTTLSFPLTLIAGIVGGSYMKRYFQNKQMKQDDQIKQEIINQTYKITQNIEDEAFLRIDKQVESIKLTLDNIFNDTFNDIENSLKTLIEDKNQMIKDISVKQKNINDTLKDLYIIKQNLQSFVNGIMD